MKSRRWSDHALLNLVEREIEHAEAERTLDAPDLVAPGHEDRTLFLRKYQDQVLQQPMLLCVVTEEAPAELVIVTVYKTSKIEKYLRGVSL